MHPPQRHDTILRTVRRHGSARVADLANDLGVSPMTIRRDIMSLVDRGALERFHGGVKLPSAAPSSSSSPRRPMHRTGGRKRTIGMVVPAASYYYREIMQGAQQAAASYGLDLVIGISQYRLDADRTQIEQLLDAGAEGLLLTPSLPLPDAGPTVEWISGLAVPAVLVERRDVSAYDTEPLQCVTSHHEQGARQAVRHLASLGHRRVALVARQSPTTVWLGKGFDEASAVLGLAPDVPRICDRPADGMLDGVIDTLLSERVTAVIAHPDEEAVMLLHQLRARNIAVPDEMSIIAYDDELAAFADVPLTAVAPPRKAVGSSAVDLLLRRLHYAEAHVLSHVHLLPRLHIRASTGPPADRSPA